MYVRLRNYLFESDWPDDSLDAAVEPGPEYHPPQPPRPHRALDIPVESDTEGHLLEHHGPLGCVYLLAETKNKAHDRPPQKEKKQETSD